jgi:hypothetical protein
VTAALETFDDPDLVKGRDARDDADVLEAIVELVVVEV